MTGVPCPGCGRPLGDNYAEEHHGPACPAIYEPGSPAYRELTERKIDRLLGRYPTEDGPDATAPTNPEE